MLAILMSERIIEFQVDIPPSDYFPPAHTLLAQGTTSMLGTQGVSSVTGAMIPSLCASFSSLLVLRLNSQRNLSWGMFNGHGI